MSFQEQLLLIFLAILPVFKLACINFILFISSSSTTLEWLTVNTTASAPSVRIGRTPWTEAPMRGTAWWLKNSLYHPKSRYASSLKYCWIVELSLLWLNLSSLTKSVPLHVWFCICKSSCTAREKGKKSIVKKEGGGEKEISCAIHRNSLVFCRWIPKSPQRGTQKVLRMTQIPFSFLDQIYFSFFEES